MKKVKKEHYMPKTNSDGADVYCPLPADDLLKKHGLSGRFYGPGGRLTLL